MPLSRLYDKYEVKNSNQKHNKDCQPELSKITNEHVICGLFILYKKWSVKSDN